MTTEMNPIKLLIVEDHKIVSRGMEMILENVPEFNVLESAEDMNTAYQRTRDFQPDVVLLDLDLGEESGIDHIEGLKNSGVKHVLVVTGTTDPKAHMKSLEKGASGTVMKQGAGTTLIEAIRTVTRGEMWLDAPMVEKIYREKLNVVSESVEERRMRSKVESLTPREREIVETLSKGLTNREIAEELGMKEKTVRNTLTSIYSKLGVSQRLELAILAPKLGLGK